MADQAAPSQGSPSAPAKSPSKGSRKSPSKSPSPLPQLGIIAAADYDDDDTDGDSSLGSDAGSSTASLASSILEYRTIHGRTFHSDKFSQYFIPNDSRQGNSMDITHHYLTVLLQGRLFLAPIPDNVHKVVDIGTGTGIWAIDFADQFPQAEITGTDISPIQPIWVPPNVKFEVDDATKLWSWRSDTFDFVHLRYLFGAIGDWKALMAEAYRCCKPGGWVQSCECDPYFISDDGSTDNNAAIKKCAELYDKSGEKLGRSFRVVADNLQREAMEASGLQDIHVENFKIPTGGWPADPTLAEVGRYVQLTLENDIEADMERGYTSFAWNTLLGWDPVQYQIFLKDIRKIFRDRKMHAYFNARYVWGRKPSEV